MDEGNNSYDHELADTLEIWRKEVSTVGQVHSSHYHCQICSLIPGELKENQIPSLRYQIEKRQEYGVGDGYDADASHVEVLLRGVYLVHPGARIQVESADQRF